MPGAQAAVSTFDDLNLGEDSYGFGGVPYNTKSGFTSGGNYFTHYNAGSYYWDGFAYSNTTNTQTAGTGNQFSAITGGGVSGSSNYAVSYTFGMSGQKSQAYIGASKGEQSAIISGTYVTNTTWAYQSMLKGDTLAKKFGGADGTDEDWFMLSFYGLDTSGGRTGSVVDFYLADFRFDNSEDDYILDQWAWVDLTGLGVVAGVEFILTSSDNKLDDDGKIDGPYAMNTPAYFAMDNFTASPVPVPGAFFLLGSGLAGLAAIRRKTAR